MKFGEKFRGIFAKGSGSVSQDDTQTEEQTRARIAQINTDIKGVEMFQKSSDSTGLTRAADAQRIKDLQAIKANLEAKIVSKPKGAEVPKPIPVVAGEKRPLEPASAVRTPQESKGTA